jgi:hypothetical protein
MTRNHWKNGGLVRVEIRPAFDDAVLDSPLQIRSASAKMVKLLQSFAGISQLRSHHGLNFEKLRGFIEPNTGEQLYSLRVTRGARVVAYLKEGPIVLVNLFTGHDKAYR